MASYVAATWPILISPRRCRRDGARALGVGQWTDRGRERPSEKRSTPSFDGKERDRGRELLLGWDGLGLCRGAGCGYPGLPRH